MPSRRTKFNTKLRFASPEPSPLALAALASKIRYGGHPAHKRNPGDFGLTPLSQPRDDKSLCDSVRILKRADALRLLKRGIEKGMISAWDGSDGFPKNVWSMTDDGTPLEAQLENPATGSYHGYPLEVNDDFRTAVIAKWNERNA
jgi:hypothetical protein